MQVQHLLNQFSSDWFITADEGQVYFRGMISEADDSVSYKTSLKQHCKPATRFSLEPNLVLFWYGNRKTGTGNQYVNLFFFFFPLCIVLTVTVCFLSCTGNGGRSFFLSTVQFLCMFLSMTRKKKYGYIDYSLLTYCNISKCFSRC